MYTQQKRLIAAALVTVVLIIISAIYWRDHRPKSSFASCAGCGGDFASDNTRRPAAVRRGEWVGGRGPYNLQLYDSPRYYPFYEGKDYMASWDKAGRCSAYCRASDDGGCAVTCR